jgi:hypothetical protein
MCFNLDPASCFAPGAGRWCGRATRARSRASVFTPSSASRSSRWTLTPKPAPCASKARTWRRTNTSRFPGRPLAWCARAAQTRLALCTVAARAVPHHRHGAPPQVHAHQAGVGQRGPGPHPYALPTGCQGMARVDPRVGGVPGSAEEACDVAKSADLAAVVMEEGKRLGSAVPPPPHSLLPCPHLASLPLGRPCRVAVHGADRHPTLPTEPACWRGGIGPRLCHCAPSGEAPFPSSQVCQWHG